MVRVLPALVELGLLVYCLIDCIQAPEADVRNLPRWGWIILIILIPLVGGVAWLVVGRPLRGQPGGRAVSRPMSAPTGYRERARPPRGPDDDPEFLAKIRRADSEHEDVLRKWEEDLRRREEELKETDRSRGNEDGEEPPAVTP
jgi:hypothetical protein